MTAEQQIIGSLLIDAGEITNVAPEIEPNMFENQICGLVYAEFLKAYSTGGKANIFSIADKYKDRPEVQMEMNYCVENTITSTGVKAAVRLMKNQYKARALGTLLNRFSPSADSVEDDISNLMIALDEMRTDEQTGASTLGAIAKRLRHDYFKEHEMINFGFKRLDELLIKLDRGDITVIGARPSVGKSALSAQLAMKLSKQNYKVGFFVLEMAAEQIYERYAAMASGISMQRIRRANAFLGDEEEKFNAGNDKLEQSELVIVTNCYTTEKIKQTVKAYKFDVVIIDYMQLVKPKRTYSGNRANEVAEISGDFKRMAKELNCHIVLLSQLNRKTEDKARPTMAELRESGAIEQDASNILLMWNLKTEGEKGLAVEKCRQGKHGGIVYEFQGDTMTFIETDKDLSEEEKWETKKKKETPFS